MHNWFEVTVNYEKMLESGMQKKVNEIYLIDALSFTEAEAKAIQEVKPFITGEFTIKAIKRSNIKEIFFNENGDRFYKAKVIFITFDEKSGAEKRNGVYMLVQSSNIGEAKTTLEAGMKGTQSDYEIGELKDTTIMDVFPFSTDKDKDKVEESKA